MNWPELILLLKFWVEAISTSTKQPTKLQLIWSIMGGEGWRNSRRHFFIFSAMLQNTLCHTTHTLVKRVANNPGSAQLHLNVLDRLEFYILIIYHFLIWKQKIFSLSHLKPKGLQLHALVTSSFPICYCKAMINQVSMRSQKQAYSFVTKQDLDNKNQL